MFAGTSGSPAVNCPYCGAHTDAEFVDVGMGYWQQVTPHRCGNCHAVEIGPYDQIDRDLLAEEIKTGWYLPTCPKCGALSGDDWSQCNGECPMPGSPHHD